MPTKKDVPNNEIKDGPSNILLGALSENTATANENQGQEPIDSINSNPNLDALPIDLSVTTPVVEQNDEQWSIAAQNTETAKLDTLNTQEFKAKKISEINSSNYLEALFKKNSSPFAVAGRATVPQDLNYPHDIQVYAIRVPNSLPGLGGPSGNRRTSPTLHAPAGTPSRRPTVAPLETEGLPNPQPGAPPQETPAAQETPSVQEAPAAQEASSSSIQENLSVAEYVQRIEQDVQGNASTPENQSPPPPTPPGGGDAAGASSGDNANDPLGGLERSQLEQNPDGECELKQHILQVTETVRSIQNNTIPALEERNTFSTEALARLSRHVDAEVVRVRQEIQNEAAARRQATEQLTNDLAQERTEREAVIQELQPEPAVEVPQIALNQQVAEQIAERPQPVLDENVTELERLQIGLNAETNARNQAIQNVQNSLGDEATRRSEGIRGVANRLREEIQNRNEAIRQVQTDLNTEIETRRQAVTDTVATTEQNIENLTVRQQQTRTQLTNQIRNVQSQVTTIQEELNDVEEAADSLPVVSASINAHLSLNNHRIAIGPKISINPLQLFSSSPVFSVNLELYPALNGCALPIKNGIGCSNKVKVHFSNLEFTMEQGLTRNATTNNEANKEAWWVGSLTKNCNNFLCTGQNYKIGVGIFGTGFISDPKNPLFGYQSFFGTAELCLDSTANLGPISFKIPTKIINQSTFHFPSISNPDLPPYDQQEISVTSSSKNLIDNYQEFVSYEIKNSLLDLNKQSNLSNVFDLSQEQKQVLELKNQFNLTKKATLFKIGQFKNNQNKNNLHFLEQITEIQEFSTDKASKEDNCSENKLALLKNICDSSETISNKINPISTETENENLFAIGTTKEVLMSVFFGGLTLNSVIQFIQHNWIYWIVSLITGLVLGVFYYQLLAFSLNSKVRKNAVLSFFVCCLRWSIAGSSVFTVFIILGNILWNIYSKAPTFKQFALFKTGLFTRKIINFITKSSVGSFSVVFVSLQSVFIKNQTYAISLSTFIFMLVRYKHITSVSAFLNQSFSYFIVILQFNIIFRHMMSLNKLTLSKEKDKRIKEIGKTIFFPLPSASQIMPFIPIFKKTKLKFISTWDVFIIPLCTGIKINFVNYQKTLQSKANNDSLEQIEYFYKKS